MTDLVDQMFPPAQRKWQAEFTDFNYWKTPIADVPLPDLSPPSPALSARSDTSNQSALARLRNLSLIGGGSSASGRPRSFQLPPPATERGRPEGAEAGDKDPQLRQMSSLERLTQTLGLSSASRSASPVSSSTFLESGSEDEGEDGYDSGEDWDRKRRKRERRTSMESMPGSLPGSEDDYRFGAEEDEEGDAEEGDAGGYDYEGETEEDPAEADFDEDLLAAGEMQNVPFL
jgi:phosphatidate phosphatase LPIN